MEYNKADIVAELAERGRSLAPGDRSRPRGQVTLNVRPQIQMSHKRADQITVSGDWPSISGHTLYGKRAFWKAERPAHEQYTSQKAASGQPG